MKGIKQHDTKDCGLASLATVFEYYGLKISISKIRKLSIMDINGISMYELSRIAQNFGFDTNALEGSLDELVKAIKKNEVILPLIAYVNTKEGLSHFVVIKRLNSKYIFLFDPEKGHNKINEFGEIWNNCILNIYPNEDFEKKNYKKEMYLKYFSLLLKVKKEILFIFVLSLIIAGISIAGAFLYKIIIDDFLFSGNRANRMINIFDITNLIVNLNQVFLFAFFFFCLQSFLEFVRVFLSSKMSKKINHVLMNNFYNHILKLPLQTFRERDTGEILSRLQDIANIEEMISEFGIILITESIFAVFGSIVLYNINSTLFGIALFMAVTYILIVFLYRNSISFWNNNVMKSFSDLNAYSYEIVSGIESIKICRSEKKIRRKLEDKVGTLLKNSFAINIIHSSMSGFLLFIEVAGSLAVLWYGSKLIYNGTISLGLLITFESLLSFFINPIKELIKLQPMLQKGLVSLERLEDILDIETENMDIINENLQVEIQSFDIHYKDIGFGYGNDKNILNKCNLYIIEGEHIAICGKNGIGKSTLAKMLVGFYHPREGIIQIDNKDLNQIPLDYLRTRVVYVPQETVLFSMSILENMRLGVEETFNDKEFIKICEACCLTEIFENGNEFLDYRISENGRDLSGGQRQVIALIRALVMNPRVLILDEATSQLDSELEKKVISNILQLNKKMTCIHITHNMELLEKYNRIITLE